MQSETVHRSYSSLMEMVPPLIRLLITMKPSSSHPFVFMGSNTHAQQSCSLLCSTSWACSYKHIVLTPIVSEGFSVLGTMDGSRFPLSPSTRVKRSRITTSTATRAQTNRAKWGSFGFWWGGNNERNRVFVYRGTAEVANTECCDNHIATILKLTLFYNDNLY